MPSKEQLPDGPHREFVEELFLHYREAGRPTLRTIATWISDNLESRNLRGTASTETVRRILSGKVVPATWLTVETILEALCGLADRSVDEDHWPDDNWSTLTFKDELRRRWNAMLDDSEESLPQLPPRPDPTPVARAFTAANDPWAQPRDEPPF